MCTWSHAAKARPAGVSGVAASAGEERVGWEQDAMVSSRQVSCLYTPEDTREAGSKFAYSYPFSPGTAAVSSDSVNSRTSRVLSA